MNAPHRYATTKERARGRWQAILPRIGIDARYLTGRHGPCPMCGGKDRFRFIDPPGQERDGMWVCNQCCPKPRPAIELVMRFTNKPFAKVAGLVDSVIGGSEPLLPSRRQMAPRTMSGSGYPARVWNRGVPVRRGDPVDRYLHGRGVGMDIYPPTLRCAPLDWYRDDSSFAHLRLPAMFALVSNSNGHSVAVHRTFLASEGSGKAAVVQPRKAAGQYGPSPAIRLTPPAPMMGIAEGIETALAAAKLFGIPTRSVICANGIRAFVPPPECRHLVVFADHDWHGASRQAADELGGRLTGITFDIQMPESVGADWNDVLMERGP